LSRTTQVSQYQKGKTNLDFTEARDSERQWHQLSNMQVCSQLQTDNHASTPPLSFFTGRMPLLLPNQQRPSTDGKFCCNKLLIKEDNKDCRVDHSSEMHHYKVKGVRLRRKLKRTMDISCEICGKTARLDN